MIYAPKAVEHIMSGKAISIAVRAHLLLDAVLNRLLLSKSMDLPLPCAAGVEQDDAESSDKTPCTNSDLKAAESLYDEPMAMTKDAEEVVNDEAIARIQAIRDGHVETLAKDPTASLWIQYLDMIRILRKFIRAERLGNWYRSILKLYRRSFRTWPLLANRCLQSPPACISVPWLTCLMVIL